MSAKGMHKHCKGNADKGKHLSGLEGEVLGIPQLMYRAAKVS
jgi:hypothetical protein